GGARDAAQQRLPVGGDLGEADERREVGLRGGPQPVALVDDVQHQRGGGDGGDGGRRRREDQAEDEVPHGSISLTPTPRTVCRNLVPAALSPTLRGTRDSVTTMVWSRCRLGGRATSRQSSAFDTTLPLRAAR